MVTAERTKKLTVQDKIDRILARLDQGEQLIGSQLRSGDQFCIMGLFADESDMGEWVTEIRQGDKIPCYKVKPIKHGCSRYGYYITSYNYFSSSDATRLSRDLVAHYGLRNGVGTFDLNKVPPLVKFVLHTIKCTDSLLQVNDRMIELEYSTEVINTVLAEIIRSGAIFKES